jgi:hypothetical protein
MGAPGARESGRGHSMTSSSGQRRHSGLFDAFKLRLLVTRSVLSRRDSLDVRIRLSGSSHQKQPTQHRMARTRRATHSDCATSTRDGPPRIICFRRAHSMDSRLCGINSLLTRIPEGFWRSPERTASLSLSHARSRARKGPGHEDGLLLRRSRKPWACPSADRGLGQRPALTGRGLESTPAQIPRWR